MAEAKIRRIADPNCGVVVDESGLEENKSKKKRCSLRCVWHTCLELVWRRGADAIGLSWTWCGIVAGDLVVRWVLIADTRRFIPYFCEVIYFLHCSLLAMFIAFWIRARSVGPGVPPREKAATVLPPELESAFRCGKLLHYKPFGPEDTWCVECNNWKPAIASHCKTCRKCCFWMDHHCNFLGCCIGFYNLRLFLGWLCYGMVIQALWALATLSYWLEVDRSDTPSSWWSSISQWLWFMFLCHNASTMRSFFHKAVVRYQVGWLTQVLEMKFQNVYDQATEMHKDIKRILDSEKGFGAEMRHVTEAGETPAQAHEALKIAIHEMMRFGRRGLFYFPTQEEALLYVFGEPPSWRWLFPFTGGTGDPLKPEHFDALACSKWGAFGEAMEMCNRLIVVHTAKLQQWEARLQGVLGGLSTESAGTR